jgi:RHS repeat-associated protein
MHAGAWGYRTDGDAGLMHVGARYYDAQVGRFITRDTVLSEHPYLYCEHGPVNAVDPSGHIAIALGLAGPPGWVLLAGAVVMVAAPIVLDYIERHRNRILPSDGRRRPWEDPRPHVTPDRSRGPIYRELPQRLGPIRLPDPPPPEGWRKWVYIAVQALRIATGGRDSGGRHP